MNKLGMTGAATDHHAAVTAWFRRAVQGRSVESMIQACEHMFGALWKRSQLPLGEVTLTAIVERVVHTAAERYPFLASLQVDSSGIHCRELRSREAMDLDELSAAIQFMFVEFLTVLGNLTAESLTPALHAELATDRSKPNDSDTTEDQAS